MAKRVKVLLVCDLHEDEVAGTESIAFGLDGRAYEIDVCGKHAVQLRDAFAPYVGAARRVRRATAGSAAGGSSRPAAAGSDRERVQAIREWARSHEHTVSERGRLSAGVLAAYEAAH